MGKSILFINQSSGYLMIDIVNAHVPYYDNIVLITGFLNPRETDLDKSVKVIKGLEYKRTNSFFRKFTWFVFWLQSLYYIFIRYRSHKLYFVSNPPLNIFSAKFTNRDFAFLVYDIYPDALSQYNYLNSSSLFYRYWESANHKAFSKAKRLFTISDRMKNAMNLNNLFTHDFKVVPVWTSNNFFKDIPDDKNQFINKYNLEGKFIIGYSGNLGKTHPVEKILDLAKKLVHIDDIMFLIIGKGDKKNVLIKEQEELKLPNLRIIDFQPTELFPQVLSTLDIGIVTLESGVVELSVPSKTFNLMSAGKPILSIANCNSELAQVIENNQIGKNFSENQMEEMTNFILELREDNDLYLSMKYNSKQTSLKFSPDNAKKMILK